LNLRPESRLHRFLIDMAAVERRQIAKASGDAKGPDLAAIVLPPNTAAEFSARASFYNLQKRRSRMLERPLPVEHGGWILYGFVDERTSRHPGEYSFSEVVYFTSVCGGGVVTSEEQRNGFDYLNFRVKYEGPYDDPQSFEGMSGGALWQVLGHIQDGAVTMADPLLSGVPFFQTKIQDNACTIVCHGRRSIYDRVIAALKQAT
jgi:hypothetical protein